MKPLILIACVLLAGCAWNKSTTFQKASYVCLVGTVTADMLITDHMLKRPNTYEKNPLLGRHPGSDTLALFGLTTIAVHTVMGNYSEFWRTYLYPAQCAASSYGVINNIRVLGK